MLLLFINSFCLFGKWLYVKQKSRPVWYRPALLEILKKLFHYREPAEHRSVLRFNVVEIIA